MAALISVKVSTMLHKELDFDKIAGIYWTDSKVVLGYISNEALRFHIFIDNRVQQILVGRSDQFWQEMICLSLRIANRPCKLLFYLNIDVDIYILYCNRTYLCVCAIARKFVSGQVLIKQHITIECLSVIIYNRMPWHEWHAQFRKLGAIIMKTERKFNRNKRKQKIQEKQKKYNWEKTKQI